VDINLGKWTQEELDAILRKAMGIDTAVRRIYLFSKLLLGLDYRESTLIGDCHTPEVFVINLSGVDCFTYLDYVEAMRLSGTFSEFAANVRKVRYRDGKVSFENRNHFFTDWPEYNKDLVYDVSEEVGGPCAMKVRKKLNVREEGEPLIPGVRQIERDVHHIPAESIDESVLAGIRTGDYVGIYSDEQGLDVSHVGILVKDPSGTMLRHASLRQGKVIDEDFREYISDKTGIVVLRPKEVIL
jgi:hypothetical protein